MQAMRRYAHKILAALLCMCLLISYTPLPASAGQWDPSVSDDASQLTQSNGTAEGSTTVNVLAMKTLEVKALTKDYVATIAEIKDDKKFDLKVEAIGNGTLTYTWTRTVDGEADTAFLYKASGDDGAMYPLSAHTDTLKDDTKHTYVYTIEVSDETDADPVSTTISVTISNEYSPKTFEDKDLGISVKADAYYKAVMKAETIAKDSSIYASLQGAADGLTIGGAWQIDLAGAPDTYKVFIGDATVTLPAGGVPEKASDFVVINLTTGKTVKTPVEVKDGKVTFDTATLGSFALAWKDPAKPSHIIKASAGENGAITPAGEVKVSDGDDATFNIMADDGYIIDVVTVNGEIADAPGGLYTFTNVTEDNQTISATFKKVDPNPAKEYTVSANVEGGHGKVNVGAADGGSTKTVDEGSTVVIYFTPDDGYIVDEVTVNDAKVQTLGNAYTISAVTENTTVTVKYKEGVQPPTPTYTATATVEGGGGKIEPASVTAKVGDSIQFTVTADKGFKVDKILADGKDVTSKLSDTGSTLSLNLYGNMKVVATFTKVAEVFTVTAGVTGEGGTISPAGDTEVIQGSSATYYIYPNEDMRLKLLMLTPKDGTATDVATKVVGGVYVLENVQSDYTLTAEFEASGVVVPEDTYYTVTASVANLEDGTKGGSISPSGVTRVKAGSSQTFTFLPEEGFTVDTVKVDDGAAFAPQGTSYTVGPVTKNTIIEVTYRPLNSGETQPAVDTFDITATAGSGGTISPSGTIKATKGGSMPFTFIPNSGYELDQVLIDDVNNADAVKAGSYRFDNVQKPYSIQALFKKKAAPVEPDYYNLTVTTGSDGSASPLGTTRVAAGATQTVFFYPNTGFVVGKVTVIDGDDTTIYTENTAEMTKLTLDAMKSDVSVDVTFREVNTDAGEQTPDITSHTLTSVAETGGTISPAGDIEVIDGESVTYTVTPEAGYTLNTVTASEGASNVNIAIDGNKATVSEVKGAATIKATFKAEATTPVEPTYRTVTAKSEGPGTISPSGQVRVATDRSVTFYLIPDKDKVLTSLTVGGEPVEVTDNSYTLPAGKEDVTIKAMFGDPDPNDPTPTPVPEPLLVTSSASTGGTISPSGVTKVLPGGEMLFTFTPDAGWHLSQVMVDKTDVTSQAQGGSYRVLGITEDTTVRATFARDAVVVPDPVTVTTSVNNSSMGSVSPEGESKVAPGSTQTFYFTPATDHKVTQVTVNGTNIPWSGLSYTLANITKDTELMVTFAPVENGEVAPTPPTMRKVITSVEGGNGTVSPFGETMVADKGSLLLTFTPEPDFKLSSVMVAGTEKITDVSASGTLRLTNITAEETQVVAQFTAIDDPSTDPEAPKYRTISASSGDGGSLSPEGDVRVPVGGQQSFVVKPNDGKKLESLTLTNSTGTHPVTDQVTNGVYTLTVQEDCSLYATFTELGESEPDPVPPTHKVTAKASPGGTISPLGTFEAAENSTVTFVLTPDAGYELKEVKDGNSVLTAVDGVCTLAVGTSDHDVIATFAPKKADEPQPSYHTVTASVVKGKGSVSPEGKTRVKDGGTQTFLFTPETDSVIETVVVDDGSGDKPVVVDGFTYTLTDVHKDTAVKVSFRTAEPDEPKPTPPEPFKITADAGQGGSVSPSGDVTVAKGSTPSFTFIPESGWQLSEVTVNNQPVTVQDNTYTFAPVTGDAKLHAEFERISAPEVLPDPIITATVQDGVGGTITPSGVHTVPRGSSPIYSFVPDEGYKVAALYVDGRVISGFKGTSFTLFNTEKDTSIEIAFEKKQEGDPEITFYNITAEATAGGTITPEGIVPVAEGEAMNFTFAAIDGYELYKVVIDEGKTGEKLLEGETLPAGSYRMSDVKADHTIKAYFTKQGTTPDPVDPDKPTGTAIITATAGEHGTIEAVNNNMAADGKVTVAIGTDQQFRITADAKYKIATVTVNGTAIEIKEPVTDYTYTFENVTTSGTIHATFELIDQPAGPHKITVTAGEGGTIKYNGNAVNEVTVEDGAKPSFTIEPNDGYEITGVYIGGDDNTNRIHELDGGTFTFSPVKADSSIRATFQKTTPVEPHTIMVSAGAGGSITPSGTDGAVKVEDGADITFSIEPNEGYTIQSVTVDSKPALNQLVNGEYTFKNVTEDHSISATFKEIDVTKQYDVTANVEGGNGDVAINGGTAGNTATTKVNEGGEATITFKPAKGYIIEEVSVDRGKGAEPVNVTDNSLKVSNITSNVTVTVKYKEEGTTPPDPDTFTVSASAGEGGTITPASQTVKPGESATFHLYPETGYVLDTLELDGVDVAGDVNGGVYVLKNVSKSCELVATFKTTGIEVPDDVYYTVKGSVKDNKGGTVSPSGTVRVKAGASQTFTFLPEEGFTLDTVSVNGANPVKATSLSYTVDSVMTNTTVEGAFRPVSSGGEPPLPVPTMWDITATAGSGGSISPSGTVQVAQGGSMPFTFIPQSGYEIAEVEIDGTPNADAKAAGAYRFDNVTSAHSIAVTFKQKQVDPTEPDYYNLTVNAGENGTVSPEGTTKVAAGASQTVFFYPDKGFVVSKVTVTDADGTTTYTENTAEMTKLTLDAMKSDVTVDVTFDKPQGGEPTPDPKTYTLTASVLTKGGSISPAGETVAVEGSSVTYTLTPEAGYHVKEVLVNGKKATPVNNSFTVSNIRTTITITASFELDASAPVEPTYRTVTATSEGPGTISPAGQMRVAADRSVTFYLIPDEGMVLSSLTVNDSPVEVVDNSYTLPAGTDEATVHALFGEPESGVTPPPTPVTYEVTSSATTGGTISPSGVTRVVSGGDVLYTFTADAGWHLSEVTVDDVPVTDDVQNNSYRLLGVTADTTVQATFVRDTTTPDVQKRYQVEASVVDNAGGKVSPVGTFEVAPGATQTFYFTPDDNKRVASVTVNDVLIPWSGLSYTLAGISGDTTIEVTFEDVPNDEKPPVKPTMYTVTTAVDGSGTVSPASAEVAEHGSLLLTFTPNDGSELTSVKVGNDEKISEVSDSGTLRLNNITAALTVSAKFETKSTQPDNPTVPEYRTIHVTSSDGGSLSPEGDVRVVKGGSQTFIIKPNEGMKLDSLMLNNKPVTDFDAKTDSTYTLPDVVDDCTLRAEFVERDESVDPEPPTPPVSHLITASANHGGTVSPSGTFDAADNSSVTFTFVPEAGYKLSAVTLDDDETPVTVTNGTYTLGPINGPHKLEATFAPETVTPPAPAYHTITASVEEGKGSVSPAGETRVKDGGTQTFLFTPASNFVIKEVTVNGQPVVVDGSTYTLADVHDDTAVKVFFRPITSEDPKPTPQKTHVISASAGKGGSVSPSGDVMEAEGSTPTFTFMPDAGWQLSKVTVDGEEVEVQNDSYTFAPVMAPATLRAEFQRVSNPEPVVDPVITASVNGGHGKISPAGAITVAYGSSQTFSFIPDEGYKVSEITVDGKTFAHSRYSYSLLEVKADTNIEVTFVADSSAKPPVVHTVSSFASAGGSIVPEGDQSVVQGNAISFLFTPYEGYELYRVVIDKDADLDDKNPNTPYELTQDEMAAGTYRISNVQGDRTIHAFFAKQGTTPDPGVDPDQPTGSVIIAATAGEHGSISPAGDVSVTVGQDATFTITPDRGYKLDTLTVDGKTETNPSLSYTFPNVQAPHTINATFEELEVLTITAEASAGGSINPSGTKELKRGESQTYTFSPDAECELVSVLVDGVEQPQAVADGSYTFDKVIYNHTIRAEFQKKTTQPVEPEYVVIHAGAGPNGIVSPSGDVRVKKGENSTTFTFMPNQGYVLDDVKVNGESVLSQMTDYRWTLTNVNSETTIYGTFHEQELGEPDPELPTMYEVFASATAGGSISPRGAVQVAENDSVSFLVTPNAGYRVKHMLVGIGENTEERTFAAEGGMFTLDKVTAPQTVRAVFERIPETTEPEDPNVNVDVQVKVQVDVTHVNTHDAGVVTPTSMTVTKGGTSERFWVYPKPGYTVESVSAYGKPLVLHKMGEKATPEPATFSLFSARASLFAADNEPGAAGAYWFEVPDVTEDLVIDVAFRKLRENEAPLDPVQTHTVTALAGAGGALTPDNQVLPDGYGTTLTVKPDSDYTLQSLQVEQNNTTTTVTNRVKDGKFMLGDDFDLAADTTVTAKFQHKDTVVDYVVVRASVDGVGGTVSPQEARVNRGGSQTFSFKPSSDKYVPDTVTVNGVKDTSFDGSFSYEMKDIQAESNLVVTFRETEKPTPAPNFYDVTASVNSTTMGSVSPSGKISVEENKSLTFKFSPNEGYRLADVLLDGSAVDRSLLAGNSYVLSNISRNYTVQGVFEKVETPPAGKAYVTGHAGSNGRISPSGTQTVEVPGKVDFTFYPDNGYAVDKVLVDGKAAPNPGNTYRLMVTEEKNYYVDVIFKKVGGGNEPTPGPSVNTHYITATAGENGSISPSGTVEIIEGEDAAFAFLPKDENYVVDYVEVDGKRVDNPGTSYTFENVKAGHKIYVAFRAKDAEPTPPPVVDPTFHIVRVGVANSYGGTVSPSGDVRVEAGKGQTFTFLPNPGYMVTALCIDGVWMPFNGTSYYLADVSNGHTIEVRFGAISAPAPTDPIDSIDRVVNQGANLLKTGDANGPLACTVVVLAVVAAGLAVTSRRRSSRGGRR